MIFTRSIRATISWISILCHCVDSFLFVNLKGDPNISTQSRISSVVLGETISKIQRSGLSSTSESIESDEGSSRSHQVDFVSPLLDYGYPPAVNDLKLRQNNQNGGSDKPILLYLPGFDGTYICPFMQFPELGTEFEVWCMTVAMEDRSTYSELKTMVLDFVKNDLTIEDREKDISTPQNSGIINTVEKKSGEDMSQKKTSPAVNTGMFSGFFGGSKKTGRKKSGRPIYIAGESFGGILASDVALSLLKEQTSRNTNVDEAVVDLQGLVLINPATCYDRSQLATAGPPVAKTPLPFYLLGLFSKLVPLFTDEFSVEQLLLILQSKALPSVIDNPCREAYMGRVALSLPTKLEFMPPSTLEWRLNEWLQTGCALMRDSTFSAFPNFRSLIVVGEKDKTLPSIAEAERLANKVTNPSKTKIHVVDGAGHASTCGSRLDLAAVIRSSFPELQKPQRRRKGKRSNNTEGSANPDQAYASTHVKRTSMKPEALEGDGPNFGMTERYDNADIGLNPLLYWSRSNFQAVQKETQERTIVVPKAQDPIQYKKTMYAVSD